MGYTVTSKLSAIPRMQALPPPMPPVIVTSVVPTFDFVWGFDWTFTVDAVTDAVQYFENASSAIPANKTVDGTATIYGNVAEGELTGLRDVIIDAELSDTSIVNAYTTSVLCKFRIWYGDWSGALPAEFTTADITALSHTDVTTLREANFSFGATASPEYRLICLPTSLLAVVGSGLPMVAPYTQTTTAGGWGSANHFEIDGVETAPEAIHPYEVITTNLFTPCDDTNIMYAIVVLPATASSFVLTTRYKAVTAQVKTVAASQNAPNSFTTAVNLVSEATVAEWVSTTLYGFTNYNSRLRIENTHGSSQDITASLTGTTTFTGAASLLSLAPSLSYGTTTFNAYDGSTDYLGASGFLPAKANFNASNTVSVSESFIGSGTTNITTTVALTPAVSGSLSSVNISYVTDTASAASANFTLTYTYFEV